MGVRDTGSEQLIKDTAKRIFFTEGRLNATTQDIADAAGVARTVINYYFRSKDILLEQVFNEAMVDMGNRIDEIVSAEAPFKKKLERFIDLFYAEFTNYPYKESFMIGEINSNEFEVKEKERSPALQNFLKEVQQEMDQGNIKKMKPVNFMLNLFSLMAYPILTRPLFKKVFELSNPQYEKLMNDRKKMIIEILLN